LEAIHLVVHRLVLRKLGILRIRVRITVPVLGVSVDRWGSSHAVLLAFMLGSMGWASLVLVVRPRVVAQVLVDHVIPHPHIGHGVGVGREWVVGERGLLVSTHHVVRTIQRREVRRRREWVRLEVRHPWSHVDTSCILDGWVLTGLHVRGLLGHVGRKENSRHLLGGIGGVENSLRKNRVLQALEVLPWLVGEVDVLPLRGRVFKRG
jgi:hypothetical protein